jgi:hypothetical protein
MVAVPVTPVIVMPAGGATPQDVPGRIAGSAEPTKRATNARAHNFIDQLPLRYPEKG